MSELVGWMIVLGLAFAIGCSLILSSELEQHSHDTAQAAFQRSAMLMNQLERLGSPSSQTPQAAAAVVLEFRRPQPRAASNRFEQHQQKNRTSSSNTSSGASSAR